MNTAPTRAAQPRWKKDAKWAFALLACASLSVSLFLHSLVQILSRETSVRITSTAIAAMFSRKGLDDETELAGAQKILEAGGTIRPFPGMDVTIHLEDLRNRTPREIRIAIARTLAEPLYDEGAAGLARRAPTPEAAQKIQNDAQLIALLSKQNHARVLRVALLTDLVTLLLLIPAILLSTRWGRFVTPAIIALVPALPLAILFAFLFLAATSEPPPELFTSLIGQAVRASAPMVMKSLLLPVGTVVIVAVLLLIVAVIGSRVSRASSRAHA